MPNLVLAYLTILLVTVALLLLVRKVVLWYWRIDTMVETLDVQVQQNNEILRLLRELAEREEKAGRDEG